MLTFSAALVEALKLKDKDLRFTIEVGGFTNSAGVTIVLASAPLVIAGNDVVPFLLPIQDNNSRVDLDGFRASFGGVGFSVLDEADYITSRLDDFNFIGKTVTVKLGTAGIAFADYATLGQAVITAMALDGNPRVYAFQTVDVQENLNQFVFVTAKSKLTSAITSSATSSTLDDASGFNLAGPFTNFEPVSVARGHIILGTGSQAEVIEWRAKASNVLSSLQRAQYGTTAKAHAAGEDVVELVSWPGHPLEILAVILSGAAIEEPAAFASVPSTWKMGTPVSLDTANWTIAKNQTRWAGWEYRTTTKQFARNFAEQEVLGSLKLFLRASASNTLALLPFIERPIPLEAARSIEKDTIQDDISWTADGDRISNRMTVEHDFDPTIGTFTKQTTFNDAASQASFGVRRPETVPLKGLRGDQAAPQAEIIAKEHFLLFGGVKPLVGVGTFLRHADLEVGDPLKVTHPQLPKREAGNRGQAAHFLKIMEKTVAFFGPGVQFALYDADLPAANKYASIAPDGTPTFGSATETQKTNYVFLNQSYRAA